MNKKRRTSPFGNLDQETQAELAEIGQRLLVEPQWFKNIRRRFSWLGLRPLPVQFWLDLYSYHKFTRSPESLGMLFIGIAAVFVSLAPFAQKPDAPIIDAFRLALVIVTVIIAYFGMWNRQHINRNLLRYSTPYIAASSFSVALFSDLIALPLLLLLIITSLGTILFALYHIFDAFFCRPEPKPVRPYGRWL